MAKKQEAIYILDKIRRPLMLGLVGLPGSGKTIVATSLLEAFLELNYVVWIIDFKRDDVYHMFPQQNPKLIKILKEKYKSEPKGYPTKIFFPPYWKNVSYIYKEAKPLPIPINLLDDDGLTKLLHGVMNSYLVSDLKDALTQPKAQIDMEKLIQIFTLKAQKENHYIPHDVHAFLLSGFFTLEEVAPPVEPGTFHVMLPVAVESSKIGYLWTYGILANLYRSILTRKIKGRKIIVYIPELSTLVPMQHLGGTWHTAWLLSQMMKQLRNVGDVTLRIMYGIQRYGLINKDIRGLTQFWMFGRLAQEEAEKVERIYKVPASSLTTLQPGEFWLCTSKGKTIPQGRPGVYPPCRSMAVWEPNSDEEMQKLVALLQKFDEKLGVKDIEAEKRLLMSRLANIRMRNLELDIVKADTNFAKFFDNLTFRHAYGLRLIIFLAFADVYGTPLELRPEIIEDFLRPLSRTVRKYIGGNFFWTTSNLNQLFLKKQKYPKILQYAGVDVIPNGGRPIFKIKEELLRNKELILEYAKKSIKFQQRKEVIENGKKKVIFGKRDYDPDKVPAFYLELVETIKNKKLGAGRI